MGADMSDTADATNDTSEQTGPRACGRRHAAKAQPEPGTGVVKSSARFC